MSSYEREQSSSRTHTPDRSRADMRRERARAHRRKQTLIVGAGAGIVLILVAVLALTSLGGTPPTVAAAPGTPGPAAPEPTVSTQPIEPVAPVEPPPVEPPVEPEPAPAPYTETVLGTSVEGRSIGATVFGTGDRRYLILGGVHGDEWGADAVEDMVDRLKADPSLVPDGAEIHVIACLNPDGRAADTRGNANEVDLNRNMPTSNWSSQLDPRDSSKARALSGGTAPGSEPESVIFMDYMKHGFRHVISVHSQGGLVDWDGAGGEALAAKIAGKLGYPVKHLGYQEYIKGSMGIYVPETWGIPIITIEMGKPGLSEGLFQGMMAVIE